MLCFTGSSEVDSDTQREKAQTEEKKRGTERGKGLACDVRYNFYNI